MAGSTTSNHMTALLVSHTAGSHDWIEDSPRRSSIRVVMLLAMQFAPVIATQKPTSATRLQGR